MLRTQHTPKNQARKSVDFPCIKQGEQSGAVIIFVSPLKGIVVDAGRSTLVAGTMANGLINVYSQRWLDYVGSITLENFND